MPGGRLEGAPARLSSRAGIVATTATLGLLVLVWAVTSGGSIAERPRRDWDPPTTAPPSPTTPTESASSAASPAGPSGASSTWFGTLVGTIFTIAVAVALLMLVFLVGRAVVNALRGRRLRRRRQHDLPMPPPVADAVARSEGAQRAALLEGPPRNAIVACWVSLERSVADAGVNRAPSETSAELTLRVLDDLDSDREALRQLAALYREARYSQHPLTEDHRHRAQDALDRFHARLRPGGVSV